jgi:hypothetical protein
MVFVTLDTCMAEPGVQVVWDADSASAGAARTGRPASGAPASGAAAPPASWMWPGLVIVEEGAARGRHHARASSSSRTTPGCARCSSRPS